MIYLFSFWAFCSHLNVTGWMFNSLWNTFLFFLLLRMRCSDGHQPHMKTEPILHTKNCSLADWEWWQFHKWSGHLEHCENSRWIGQLTGPECQDLCQKCKKKLNPNKDDTWQLHSLRYLMVWSLPVSLVHGVHLAGLWKLDSTGKREKNKIQKRESLKRNPAKWLLCS